MTTFTVITSTPNQKGGFVWKLSANTVADAFGLKKTVKRTYYIGGMPSDIAPGTEIKEDLNRFEITPRVVKDEDGTVVTDNDGLPIMIKWLHVKVA